MAKKTVKTQEITLTQDQCESYKTHNEVVEQGMATFVAVGKALKAIQDGNLFLAEFKSFTEYCSARLNMSKSQGYRLVSAVAVFDNIKGIAAIDPISESQIRSLKDLKPANQKKAWKNAVEGMGESTKLPAIQVRRAAEELEGIHFKKSAPKAKVPAQPIPKDADKEALWAELEKAIESKNL